MQLFPASDTTVDSTGVLLIRVEANDQSPMKRLEFSLIPATIGYPPINPKDTTIVAFYHIPLAAFKHSSFSFTVRAVDVLDNQTDTPAVTVTVR